MQLCVCGTITLSHTCIIMVIRNTAVYKSAFLDPLSNCIACKEH